MATAAISIEEYLKTVADPDGEYVHGEAYGTRLDQGCVGETRRFPATAPEIYLDLRWVLAQMEAKKPN